MQRQAFRFFHPMRVRWAEVDMQKIVFNAHYLMYFDTAMADYWRALALPYEASLQALQGDLYVRKATLEYHASARADERIDVGLRCSRIGNSSLLFEGGVFRGDTLLVGGELVYVFADPATQTPRPVPELLRSVLQGFEAGESMLDIRTGSWDTLQAHAGPLRTAVFVQEQGIPAELEWDADDASALHAVAFNRLGLPVATGRLVRQADGAARIGRMAVLPLLRGAAVGRAVLDALVEAARARGDRQIVLHAQRCAEGFYRRAGFAAQGDPYEEAGIAHITMARTL
ncbi:YbgC/FadM family acyl-CoA thioesterase [Acidovorax sp. SRB_24]|uniref:YbgC/FadM family acyl-CoA thioesterase n=1 Tax=Acidovorax sp. SRB_24 TaxID=1962700 RepID=UPI00145EF64E|nr:YbgC/FadM family acyl-CoA thioesterase [Acidovorax sp. SRB_24]NMM75761.1 4-hydroxybenzoyl-CoA thioesterase [Acidovorax sp. SRB_24]